MIVWSPAQYESKPNSSARLATIAGSALLCGVTCISPIFIFAPRLVSLLRGHNRGTTARQVMTRNRRHALPGRCMRATPLFHNLAQAAGGSGDGGVLQVGRRFVVNVYG